MSESSVPAISARFAPVSRSRSAWWPTGIALAVATGYVVFFVLPYLVNHLYRFPLADVAIGFHDPKDLWPSEVPVIGLVFAVGALLTLLLGPVVATGALVWSLAGLWHERTSRNRSRRATRLLGVLAAVGVLVWLATPLGSALVRWWLD